MVTSSGFLTNPFTTYSRKLSMHPSCQFLSRLRSGRGGGCFAGLLDKGGHGFAGLRAFGNPVFSAIEVQREIVVATLQWQIGAKFLDAFAITRAAVVGHHD